MTKIDEKVPKGYKSSILKSIQVIIEQARTQVRQTVNSAMVIAYWHIGRLIVEDELQGEHRAEYGKQRMKELSKALTAQYGKGFSLANVKNMKQFYISFKKLDKKSYALRSQLSWTHYRILMRIENPTARDWYMNEAINQNWSTRALERQINVLYFERLLSSNDKGAVEAEANEKVVPLQDSARDYLRDPYVLDFLNLPADRYLENELEQALIENLQKFLLELGRGFAFVGRQQRLSVEEKDFYIDLVFYNFKLKCFMLVDLKLGELGYQDVGQMDTYVRVYDEIYKGDDDNSTIGLILCSKKSKAVAKYSVLADSEQLFSAKYLPFLPTEEELQRELERERELTLTNALNSSDQSEKGKENDED